MPRFNKPLVAVFVAIGILFGIAVVTQTNLLAQGRMVTTTGVVFVRGIIGSIPLTIDNIVTTSTDGLLLQNTTAATVGVPVQYSPRLRLCGTAWKTDATTASQIDCDLIELRPVSAAGATTSSLVIGTSIAGGAYTDRLTLSSAGLLTAVGGTFSGTLTANQAAGGGLTINNPSADAGVTGQSYFAMQTATANRWYMGMSSCASDGAFGLYNNINAGCAISVSKAATSPVTFTGTLTPLAYVTTGSGMAVANVGANSCGTSAATIAGNNNANVTTVGATAGTQCRIAFTFAAATEWDCAANDDTTTVAVRTTPVDTTHTDLIGTFTAGDKISAICFPR